MRKGFESPASQEINILVIIGIDPRLFSISLSLVNFKKQNNYK